MKKILSLILVLAMTFSLSTTALAAYGYNIYKKSGSSDKLYLRVNDNWGTSARYVDTTYIGSLGHTLFEICRVIP